MDKKKFLLKYLLKFNCKRVVGISSVLSIYVKIIRACLKDMTRMLIYLFIHEHRVESMKTEFFSVQETNTLRLFQRKKTLFRLVFLELK